VILNFRSATGTIGNDVTPGRVLEGPWNAPEADFGVDSTAPMFWTRAAQVAGVVFMGGNADSPALGLGLAGTPGTRPVPFALKNVTSGRAHTDQPTWGCPARSPQQLSQVSISNTESNPHAKSRKRLEGKSGWSKESIRAIGYSAK
jgi:hypothetical protein